MPERKSVPDRPTTASAIEPLLQKRYTNRGGESPACLKSRLRAPGSVAGSRPISVSPWPAYLATGHEETKKRARAMGEPHWPGLAAKMCSYAHLNSAMSYYGTIVKKLQCFFAYSGLHMLGRYWAYSWPFLRVKWPATDIVTPRTVRDRSLVGNDERVERKYVQSASRL